MSKLVCLACLFIVLTTAAGAAPAIRDVTYTEVWRAGDDDSADYLFGVISGIAEDETGHLYLLDTQQQQVMRFGPDGTYRGLVCRRGAGPGEIENSYTIRYLGDGLIGAKRNAPPGLVVVDTTGIPQPSVSFTLPPAEVEARYGYLLTVEPAGSGYVANGRHHLMDGSGYEQFVAVFDAEGEFVRRLATSRGGYDFTRPITVDEEAADTPWQWWEVSADGRIFHTVDRDSYLVEIRNPDGVLIGSIRRDHVPRRRTHAEKDAAKANYSFSSNGELPPISYRMADTAPALTSLMVRGDEVLIGPDPGAPADADPDRATPRVLDVYDLDGRYLETRRLHIDFEPGQDAVHFLPSGRVVVVANLIGAMENANPDRTSQSGEERREAGTFSDADPLEVIVFEPVDR